MEPILLSVILILAGLLFFVRNFIYFVDEEKLINYLKTSPKGKLWIEKFGYEKTYNLTKKVFLPIGMIFSLVFITASASILYTINTSG